MKQSLPKLTALLLLLPFSCKEKNTNPTEQAIKELHLKEGTLITCGPPDREFGSVVFETSCTAESADFNLAMELLHSFEYDEAEKVFARIIGRNRSCAMAYWGVAMSNFHPLWAPPTIPELKKGAEALAIARNIQNKSGIEQGYIDALSAFYSDWDRADHHTRCLRFEKAMEDLHARYPKNNEATILYALSLTAAADPADKTLGKQRKAGTILLTLYRQEPNHPGIVHYIIHAYDYPELAGLALPAAKKYATLAPSSAHALHMPSHIFTRLGLWDDCIRSNLVSISAAQCYAKTAGIKGHWDEELHGMDYLVYAYLQKGEKDLARRQWDSINAMEEVYPVNFKVAYAFAAIPSRYVLENRLWKEAAGLQLHPANFPWKSYRWQEAIVHFTRLMGNVHLGHAGSAENELSALNHIYDGLIAEKDAYKATQVLIQLRTAQAWLKLKAGKTGEALDSMRRAADLEDRTEKHPVTPCEIIPARELLGDMLLQTNHPREALEAYEADLKRHPNRLNGLHGARQAAEALKKQTRPGRHPHLSS